MGKKIVLILLGLLYMLAYLQAQIRPSLLTCEYVSDPAVVDVLQPRLSWINVAAPTDKNQFQTAWQIRVASSPALLAEPDLWKSEKVLSDQNNRILYTGKPLTSEQECWWQVRVWDKNQQVSSWSKPARWRMGLLKPADWKARWIGAPWQGEETLPKIMDPKTGLPKELPPPSPYFRKTFQVVKKVRKAVLFVTGLGYFEAHLNGKKIGDDVLVPNQTNYGKRPGLPREGIPLEDDFREYKVMYLAYDVTGQLQTGKNAIGMILGNGFFNPANGWALGYGTPRLLAQLHVTYSDGTEDVIGSDESWKVAKGPICMDMVYYGEHYDARFELPGWNEADCADNGWQQAILRKPPEGRLAAHTAHADKVMETLKPVRFEKLPNGRYRVDFGVEVSGWVRLKNITGPAGHQLRIHYLGTTYSGDNYYTFGGNRPTSYAARFNWFVFNGVEIENYPGMLVPEQVTAEVVHTYVKETAKFETSDTLLNTLHRIWKRSQTDNMHGGVASDCPHRERSPYTGDGQVACVTVMHNYDARNFYHKWIQDIQGAQNRTTGYVPNGAPWQPGCGGGVGWGAAMCIMPWEFYRQYGAKDMLEDNYSGMKEYVRYMQNWVGADGIMHSQRTGKDGKVLPWFNLGDWVAPGPLPPDNMVHTFFLWRCADYTAKAAEVLGKAEEAVLYGRMAEKTKEAFIKRFFDAEKGSFGRAGGNIFALRMGLPTAIYHRVVEALKADILASDGHLDTGIFGTQFFFEVLSENGMHDWAYRAMTKRTQPGYGWWIAQGATTTWEQWDGGNSRNHPMFGGGIVWLYRKLAGMQLDSAQPGYKHIVFRPQPVEQVSFLRYSNQTGYGQAGISWKQQAGAFDMQIIVPVGARATVYVPVLKNRSLKMDGKSISGLRIVDGYWQYEVGSGQYTFQSM